MAEGLHAIRWVRSDLSHEQFIDGDAIRHRELIGARVDEVEMAEDVEQRLNSIGASHSIDDDFPVRSNSLAQQAETSDSPLPFLVRLKGLKVDRKGSGPNPTPQLPNPVSDVLVEIPNDVRSGWNAGLHEELQETKASSNLVSVLDSRSLIPVREAGDENKIEVGVRKRLDQLTSVPPHCLQDVVLLVHGKNEPSL